MPPLVPWLIGFLVLLLASPARADVVTQDALAPSALLAAPDVPDDFVEETAFDDLVAPASVAFSPDGRVLVAQLDGVIKVFDSLQDTSASVYADLSRNVAFHGDRGLLGMTLDPGFATGRPYVYVLYTYDAAIGAAAPRWNDQCPDPPGAERDGCVVSGRLSKILPDGSEMPLIADEWCQQYSSHSVGDLHFGPDGALYATAGDGASYTFADYGQDGSPVNPCGDPPRPVGGAQTPPTAEGGALRSQDLRTSADPTGLDGTMIRVDPDTGDPLPTNPGTGDLNARRIVAHGFRNPFRWAFRPGTTEAYVGDVGWLAWEELDRVPDTTSQVRNYGWPCYEGTGRQGAYDASDLDLCNGLYAAGTSVPPIYTYNHGAKVADESCSVGTSSISGVAFYSGATFPAAYHGAMFFADYARGCIWVMFPGPDGTPNPSTRQVFVDGARTPVDLEMGPGGDLYYADVGGGTIRRVRAANPNQAPTAAFSATPAAGAAPLEVEFDGTGSSDPNDDPLDYAWDLDGDGEYDDSTAAAPTRTYTAEGSVTVRLRVTDPAGLSDTHQSEVTVGTPPTPAITGPAPGVRYAIGDTVAFSGTATRDGAELPAAQLTWTLDLHHCSALVPTSCHVHHVQDFAGVRSGSFAYPDHEYPSFLSLGLTATLPSGLRGHTSVRIDPKTVELTFQSVPSGLRLAVGGESSTAPFTRTVAQGSTVGVAAPPSQFLDGFSYDFGTWSDGGAATHQLVAPAAAATFTAAYTETPCPVLPGLAGAWAFDEPSGSVAFDTSGRGNAGTLSGATRSADGRFGGALSFDGVNDLVTVADSNSLDLVAGMTLEAWVNPTASGASWRTVALKEQPGNLAYALYASDDGGRPSGHVATPVDSRAGGPAGVPVGSWTHLATTFDGSTLRLYVDGAAVASEPVLGDITVSGGALRIGGNTVWDEWFAGRIDELRIYDRALSPTEVQADMTRPITCAGSPRAPALSVSPAGLSFTATQAGSSPAAKTLGVSNSGGGTLQWTAADDAAWLSTAPAGGTGGGTVTVAPDISGLAAGTYTANVTLTASGATGSPRVVPVSLTVEPAAQPPVLAVTPATLSFTAVQGAATVETKAVNVADDGGGTLQFAASANVPWLNVTPATGTAPRAVSVTPSTAGLAPGTHTGSVTVTAAGVSGSPRTVAVTFTVTEAPACGGPAGLVGAWGFDETSGATAADASPAGNPGTLSGATRTAAGRFGGALTFDGVNDWVSVADAGSLDLTTGMTLSAWVNPATAGGGWRTVLLKERGGGLTYALYGNADTNQPSGHVFTSVESSAKGASGLPAGVWSHLAATFDGSTLRLFVNGVQVSSRAVGGAMPAGTGPLRIGGNGVWQEWFAGRIDEVRVYDRALAGADLQADMAAPVTCSGPAALTVSPASVSFAGTSPAAKTLDVAAGSSSWSASESAPWLSVAPAGGTGPGTITVTPSPGGLSPGTYTATVTVTAAGASGSPKTVPVTFTVTAPGPAAPPGLVAAYGFEETGGTGATDASGSGLGGTLSGPARSASGRFGRALSFDGVNDWVTVADADPLDLTAGVTISAWVNPVAVGSGWRTVLMKEQTGGIAYSLYAGEGSGRPAGQVFTTSELGTIGPANTPVNTWTHLASTWDGTTLRLFVNGTQASSRAAGGTLRTTTGALRIGGNGVWSEWFRGLIDEVRLYDRALTPTEIQADMTRAVAGTG